MSDDVAVAAGTETATAQSNETAQTSGSLLGDALGATDNSEADTAETPKAEGEVKTEAPKAPEEYADFVAPEDVQLDADRIAAFKALAKENGLTQEAAQKLVDLGIQNQKALMESVTKAWDAQNKAWMDELNADPEVGGDKLPQAKATAVRAIEATGIDGFKDVLNNTKAGNIPQLFKAFNQYGRLIEAAQATGLIGAKDGVKDFIRVLSAPEFTTGRPVGGANASKTAAQVLYPDQP